MLESLNRELPVLSEDRSLTQRLKRWHERAERFLGLAVATCWAEQERKAERAKGSLPTARPTSPPPAHCLEESMAMRRLKRLHRKLAERVRYHGAENEGLCDSLFDTYTIAVRDGLVQAANGIPTCGRTLDDNATTCKSLTEGRVHRKTR